jgi:uncharacterized protein YjbJ (UPF0337 family)
MLFRRDPGVTSRAREVRMNWDQIEGKWKQVTGSAKQKWDKLTDDDLAFINGSKDKFLGRLQERYGLSKEEAQNQVEAWTSTIPATEAPSKSWHESSGAGEKERGAHR